MILHVKSLDSQHMKKIKSDMLIKRLFRKSSIHNFFCDCDLEFFQESIPQITQHLSNRISRQKISIKLSRNLIKVTPTHGNSPEELLHHLTNLQEAVHRKLPEFLSKLSACEAFHAQCSILFAK